VEQVEKCFYKAIMLKGLFKLPKIVFVCLPRDLLKKCFRLNLNWTIRFKKT
jgi:hypothetical protein